MTTNSLSTGVRTRSAGSECQEDESLTSNNNVRYMPTRAWKPPENDFQTKLNFDVSLTPEARGGHVTVIDDHWDWSTLISVFPRVRKTTAKRFSGEIRFRCVLDPGSKRGSPDPFRWPLTLNPRSYSRPPCLKTTGKTIFRQNRFLCSFDLGKATNNRISLFSRIHPPYSRGNFTNREHLSSDGKIDEHKAKPFK